MMTYLDITISRTIDDHGNFDATPYISMISSSLYVLLSNTTTVNAQGWKNDYFNVQCQGMKNCNWDWSNTVTHY